MKKKISYITLISDLYILLAFTYIIYGIFFGFERIGTASYTIKNINSNMAIIVSIIEIIFSIIMAYLLHKSNHKTIRIVLMLLCVSNIIYRIINILAIVNPFTIFMILINVILFIILLLY